jgi:RND family efflux transporter MFP subunit
VNSNDHSPNRLRTVLAGLVIVAALGVFFVAGYLPRRAREQSLVRAAEDGRTAIPQVIVGRAKKSPASTDLLLPGNITPITEALIQARAAGYLKRRLVDIGDRVAKGQLLGEIEAPELDQQVRQAEAGVQQASSTLTGARHNLRQAEANLKLAKVTAERWRVLVAKGVVSRQEADQKDADYERQQASVEAFRSAIRVAEDNIHSSEANLRRLVEMLAFTKVSAPFAGIVTARNVDLGSLIAPGGALPLFRIAQIGTLRIMVDVPQSSAPFVRVGQRAEVTLQELPGRKFDGRVSRTANALDAATRTLPTEVQVANPGGVLMPNMYAQVRLFQVAASPSVLIPGDALIVRAEGTLVAVVAANRIHFQKVEVGRDYGPLTEIRAGLSGDEYVVTSPSDDVREGAEVRPLVVNRETPAGAEPSRPAQRH